jgi:hypothetical protein
MPVVSDYTLILGDENVAISDSSNTNGWDKVFNTGGRETAPAFITFMVRGMTQTDANAEIFINNELIGHLFNNKGGNRDHWHTQTVAMGGASLKDGDNVIRVETVPIDNPGAGVGALDDFQIRNVICHFKQNV